MRITRMVRWRAVLISVPLVVAAAACARHRAGSFRPISTEWSLTVENHHWLDVEVYVLHGGQTTRVGLITAASSQSFVLPAYLLGVGGDIQLVATPVGSGERLVTPFVSVSAGQAVEWTLERMLRTSSLAVH